MSVEEVDFTKLKGVDERSKNIVFGYLRRSQKLLTRKYMNISPLIYYICLHYYNIPEHWTINEQYINHIQLNNSRDTVEITMDERITIYGTIYTHNNKNCVYRWDVKIINCAAGDTIYIGIDSSNKQLFNKNFCNKKSNGNIFYAISSEGEIVSQTHFEGYYCGRFNNEDDVVRIELDTKNKTFKGYKNGIESGVAFYSINLSNSFNFAASMSMKSSCLQLINFEQFLG